MSIRTIKYILANKGKKLFTLNQTKHIAVPVETTEVVQGSEDGTYFALSGVTGKYKYFYTVPYEELFDMFVNIAPIAPNACDTEEEIKLLWELLMLVPDKTLIEFIVRCGADEEKYPSLTQAIQFLIESD